MVAYCDGILRLSEPESDVRLNPGHVLPTHVLETTTEETTGIKSTFVRSDRHTKFLICIEERLVTKIPGVYERVLWSSCDQR